MISCTKTNDNKYSLDNLSLEDLEVLQEGIIRLFHESLRDEHRDFRTQVLRINRAIEPVLDVHEKQKQNF